MTGLLSRLWAGGWERLADRLANEKTVITRTGEQVPYLTRWTLFGRRATGRPGGLAVFLHKFERSDPDHLHDHPWSFTSVILAGGYFEVTPADPADPLGPAVRTWHRPGSVLVRPHPWPHRIELPPGGTALTLVLRGRKRSSWGFWCPDGWRRWTEYGRRLDAGLPPCGDE